MVSGTAESVAKPAPKRRVTKKAAAAAAVVAESAVSDVDAPVASSSNGPTLGALTTKVARSRTSTKKEPEVTLLNNIVMLDKKPIHQESHNRTLQPHPDHVLNDANLVFTEKGLRMTMIDQKMICASFLSMDASYFEMYYCKSKQTLGVDIHWLYKVIKPLRMNDILSFIVHKDERDELRIIMENPEKGTKAEHKIKLKLLPDDEWEIKDQFQFEFDIQPPEIDSAYFQSICRNLHSVHAQEVEITYSSDKLKFRGLKGETESTFEIQVAPAIGEDGTTLVSDDREVKGSFLLYYLHNFTKAAHHLSQKVRIALQQEHYLLIEYVMNGTNNSLRYLLFQYDPE